MLAEEIGKQEPLAARMSAAVPGRPVVVACNQPVALDRRGPWAARTWVAVPGNLVEDKQVADDRMTAAERN